MISFVSRAAVAAAAIFSCAVLVVPAGAATLTTEGTNVLPDPITFMEPHSATSPTAHIGVSGSVAGEYRSPFAIGASNVPAAGYEGSKYNSVGNNTTLTGSITHTLVTGTQDFKFIWGSPDAYNTLTLLDEFNNVIDTFTGSDPDLIPPGIPAQGNVAVRIQSDAIVYSIVFSSTLAAFEYANLIAIPAGGEGEVPLPPALVLFGSALVGMTMLARRRRAAKAGLPA